MQFRIVVAYSEFYEEKPSKKIVVEIYNKLPRSLFILTEELDWNDSEVKDEIRDFLIVECTGTD